MESVVIPLSFISYNVYLIPGWLGHKSHQVCVRQDSRASDIGKFIKDQDVIALQEMWGSNVYPLETQLEPTHQILTENKTTSYNGWGGTMLDSVKFFYCKNGGLWFSCRKNSQILYTNQQTFNISQTWSFKGIKAVLLDLYEFWGGTKSLLVFNTHLDPYDQNNIKLQLTQIYAFIGQTLVSIKEKFPNFDPSSCGVILCGDFNIRAHSALYDHFLSKIFHNCFRDIYAEFCLEYNISESPTYQHSNSLASAGGSDSRLDYVLVMDKFIFETGGTWEFLKLKATEASVYKQEKGVEMSDHWPLSVKLIYES